MRRLARLVRAALTPPHPAIRGVKSAPVQIAELRLVLDAAARYVPKTLTVCERT
jgi:hypothetical protein